MRIAVISPFVDRQHGTERALAELLDRLSAQHGDTIDLYAQKVSDLNYEPESSVEKTDHGRIIWHRVKASRASPQNGGSKPGIRIRIASANTCGDGDLADDSSKDAAALCVSCSFLMLDGGPF